MTRRTNGEGSVYRRHDHETCPSVVNGARADHRCLGRWAGALVYVDPLSGQRKRKVFYGDKAGDVRAKIKAAKDRLAVDAPEGGLTGQFLRGVGEAYDAAVERGEYVSRARKRGLLPPTKKGKKKA